LGVWALVLGFAAATIIELVIVIGASKTGRFPRLSLAHMRGVLDVGAATAVNRLINFAGSSADRFFAAPLLGAAALGLYTRAGSLFLLPVKLVGLPMEKVLLATFSRTQKDLERMRRGLEQIFEVQTIIYLPIGVGLAVTAPLLVEVVLGAKWQAATPIAQVLFVTVFARLGYIASEAAAVAIGGAWGAARRQAIFAVIFVICSAVGASRSLLALAVGVSVARFVLYLMSLNYIVGAFGCSWRSFAIAHVRACVLCSAAFGSSWFIEHQFAAVRLLGQPIVAPVVYWAIFVAWLSFAPPLMVGVALDRARREILAHALKAVRNKLSPAFKGA
jgi:O-antigen/teichoic acid export membrane protein